MRFKRTSTKLSRAAAPTVPSASAMLKCRLDLADSSIVSSNATREPSSSGVPYASASMTLRPSIKALAALGARYRIKWICSDSASFRIDAPYARPAPRI